MTDEGKITRDAAHLLYQAMAETERAREEALQQLQERDEQLRAEISDLSLSAQAAFVLVEAASLENILEELLRENMPNLTKKLGDKLFNKGLGALRSFSAKIDIAFAFRVIEAEHHSDLHAIRDIRNELAHTRQHLNLESKEIAKLFQKFDDYKKGEDRQNFFFRKVQNMKITLLTTIAYIEAKEEGGEN